MTMGNIAAVDTLPPPGFDPIFHLPLPPVTSVFDLSVGNTVTAIYGTGIALFLIWALLRSNNRAMAFAMIVGGAAVTFLEPVFDVLTAVWHPQIHQNVAFTLLGREVPIWAFFGYMAYYGCTGYLMLGSFLRGATTRVIWLWCLVPIFFDFLIEESMLHWNLYYYYSTQPFRLIRFPLYQPACNTVGVFFAVTLLYLLAPYLKKSWRWFPAAIVILPFCGGMGFVGASLPAMYALNAPSVPNWLMQLSGVASYALMFAWVYGVSLIVSVDSPYRYRPGESASLEVSRAPAGIAIRPVSAGTV